jgi:2,4-dienoyl-CoA reductase (NADPH2)
VLQEAGYDGVEVMGSEGYLLNQFVAARTNQRTGQSPAWRPIHPRPLPLLVLK